MKKFSIILTILMFIVGCSGNENNETVEKNSTNLLKQNSNPEVIKKQEIDNISFDNIRLISNENMSTFTADVVNMSDEIKKISYIKIIIYDNDNKSVFTAYIGEELFPNEKVPLVTNVEGDLTNAISIKYEIIYEED
ncbi:MAG: hypothetical protein NC181_02685 [Clostridium sp.]|nr:hypothetical protein [Clostridium sp.]MCM1444132.1 hypothetical protein [Candidatus Amulumruptor caecigallinarius]